MFLYHGVDYSNTFSLMNYLQFFYGSKTVISAMVFYNCFNSNMYSNVVEWFFSVDMSDFANCRVLQFFQSTRLFFIKSNFFSLH